jgi:cbb3-type cytochrome oxidase subunit 1
VSASPPASPASGLSPTVPLRYLGTAAGAYVLAALGVVWLAPELSRHYYHPRVLALTHLVTLGWVTLSIVGASYQIVPIVLGRPVWSERLARWQFWILVASIAGMVSHFHLGTWPGLAAAAVLLAVGIALHLTNLIMTLRGFRHWTLTTRAVLMGHVGRARTARFGVAQSNNPLWPFLPGNFLSILHAHAHLALLGWVTPMVLGVTARVYPMFLLAPEPSVGLGRIQLWGLAAGVPLVVVGLLAAPSLVLPGAVGLTAAATAHGLSLIVMTRGRKRPALDWGLRFTLTGAAFLVPLMGAGLGLALDLLSGPRAALAYAVLALGGWISLTIAE